ncbi:hypothetical protein EV363DRAFT_1106836, partial [Boletus edulis]
AQAWLRFAVIHMAWPGRQSRPARRPVHRHLHRRHRHRRSRRQPTHRPRPQPRARLLIHVYARTCQHGGDEAVYDGHLWTAKWWTENDPPGSRGTMLSISLVRLDPHDTSD